MKVKVGTRVYDGEIEPVMVILSEKDKENIRDMGPRATKYCSYPEGWTDSQAVEFMAVPGPEERQDG